MQNISILKHFNIKEKRNGSLFESSFKGKHIKTDEDFIHVSRYIHLNPVTSLLIGFKDLSSYPWTSFSSYINKTKNTIVNKDFLLNMFSSREGYKAFVANQVDYQRKLALIGHLIIDI